MDDVVQQLNFDEEEEMNCSSSGCDVEDEDSSIEDYSNMISFPSLNKSALENFMDYRSLVNAESETSPQHIPNNSIVSTPLGSNGPRFKLSQHSPPCKRIRALKLFSSPNSPKTLLKNANLQTPTSDIFKRLKAVPLNRHSAKFGRPTANENPFTPENIDSANKKRARTRTSFNGSLDLSVTKSEICSEESDGEIEQPIKRVAIQDTNVFRYDREYQELSLIGRGEFGTVYKCKHRIDGMLYAIKKSKKPIANSVEEKLAYNEVWAHAVLGKHEHVVRYHSAWAERNHMMIQSEYCNGGSLADAIKAMDETNSRLNELELKQILLHVAKGLYFIHSMHLVHKDIKPANIFILRERSQAKLNFDSDDDGFDEEEAGEEEMVTYKIGDLGHVTSIADPLDEEGDQRYLPSEILQNNFNHLTKADIFALGLTIYEAGGGGPLPENGDEWHAIREGKLKKLQYSEELNKLIRKMVHIRPEERPSAKKLIKDTLLSPNIKKVNTQLKRELNAEKLKNHILTQKLEDATKCLKSIAPNIGSIKDLFATSEHKVRPVTTRTSNRVIGKNVNRSASTTLF